MSGSTGTQRLVVIMEGRSVKKTSGFFPIALKDTKK
jgi:hypothetical protein